MQNRKIPATMVSQHPDHAGKPYWQKKEFIDASHEVEECYRSFSELGVSEYKWDWEGKYVDESVIERLFSEHYGFFKENPVGREKILTFRLPNPKVETEFRLGRAFMGILSAGLLAKQLGFHTPPLFEVILPMTESPDEMLDIQEAYSEMVQLKHRLYNFQNGNLKQIEVIPLFEQVSTIIKSDSILKTYIILHKKTFGFTPSYIRPYVARSDPALNSGLVATILAVKIALSRYKILSKETNIELFPIIGTGSLPFRGGITPETITDFLTEYRGVKTALLQSAFRYDFEKKDVIKAIKFLENELQKTDAILIPDRDEVELLKAISIFESFYQKTIVGIASLINKIATILPKRRERVLHIGLFGYSRGVGGVRLPRAIGFTGALYSIGIPPEFIGTGRGIKGVKKQKLLPQVEKYYINFKKDLIYAGRFLNKGVLKDLSKKNSSWKSIYEDVSEVERFLGTDFNPETKDHLLYQKLTSEIYKSLMDKNSPVEKIRQAAVLRKSMG